MLDSVVTNKMTNLGILKSCTDLVNCEPEWLSICAGYVQLIQLHSARRQTRFNGNYTWPIIQTAARRLFNATPSTRFNSARPSSRAFNCRIFGTATNSDCIPNETFHGSSNNYSSNNKKDIVIECCTELIDIHDRKRGSPFRSTRDENAVPSNS